MPCRALSNLWMILIKATPLLFLLGVQDIVYYARELGGSKTQAYEYPHGDWRLWYFLGLLVFYLVFTRVSEIGIVPADRGGCRTARPPPAAKICERPRHAHDLLGNRPGLCPALDRHRRERFCRSPTSPVPAVHADRLGPDLEPLLRGPGADLRLLPCQCHRAGQPPAGPWVRKPAEWFVFVFRGSPLFIQFFLAYEALVLLPKAGIPVFGLTIETSWTTRAWAGALLVLFLNTAAYSAEIFYGALKSIPKGDLEAAEAYGLTGWKKFRRIEWPTMLRLGWPAYTNEAIFLFHATTLVFSRAFRPSSRRAMRSITRTISPTRPSTPSSPIRSSAFYFILPDLTGDHALRG
jgi:ABC-type arginine/histidine transport system permease subunit